MRWPTWTKPETPQDFEARMDQLQRDTAELERMTPEDVAGHPLEAVYYARRVRQLIVTGRAQETRPLIRKMLLCAPANGLLRIVAADAYKQMGESGEAIAQLGVAIAIQPENYAVHPHLAALLVQRGEHEAAAAVLEQGWIHRSKTLPQSSRAAEKQTYFRTLRHTTESA